MKQESQSQQTAREWLIEQAEQKIIAMQKSGEMNPLFFMELVDLLFRLKGIKGETQNLAR